MTATRDAGNTPTPWRVLVNNQTINVKYKPVSIEDASGFIILRVGDDAEALTLAELIVRAVNAYTQATPAAGRGGAEKTAEKIVRLLFAGSSVLSDLDPDVARQLLEILATPPATDEREALIIPLIGLVERFMRVTVAEPAADAIREDAEIIVPAAIRALKPADIKGKI